MYDDVTVRQKSAFPLYPCEFKIFFMGYWLNNLDNGDPPTLPVMVTCV
jgi:hypothetical protein